MYCVRRVLMGPSAQIISQDQLLRTVLGALWACLLACPSSPGLRAIDHARTPLKRHQSVKTSIDGHRIRGVALESRFSAPLLVHAFSLLAWR